MVKGNVLISSTRHFTFYLLAVVGKNFRFEVYLFAVKTLLLRRCICLLRSIKQPLFCGNMFHKHPRGNVHKLAELGTVTTVLLNKKNSKYIIFILRCVRNCETVIYFTFIWNNVSVIISRSLFFEYCKWTRNFSDESNESRILRVKPRDYDLY